MMNLITTQLNGIQNDLKQDKSHDWSSKQRQSSDAKGKDPESSTRDQEPITDQETGRSSSCTENWACDLRAEELQITRF